MNKQKPSSYSRDKAFHTSSPCVLRECQFADKARIKPTNGDQNNVRPSWYPSKNSDLSLLIIAFPKTPSIPNGFSTPTSISTNQWRKVKANAITENPAEVHSYPSFLVTIFGATSESVVLTKDLQIATAGAKNARGVSLTPWTKPCMKAFNIFASLAVKTIMHSKSIRARNCADNCLNSFDQSEKVCKMKSYVEEKKERRCTVNKNIKLVVLGSVLMGAVAVQAETLPQVVQSVNNTISATAEENRKTVVQLGSQLMQEREQKQLKEAAAHDQQLVKAAKAQQADLRGSVQKTNYVATTYQAGPKYEALGDPLGDSEREYEKHSQEAEDWVKSLGKKH